MMVAFPDTGGTVCPTEPVSNNGSRKGTLMFATLVVAALVVVLVAAIGMPYKQTWYGRWNPHR